MKTIPAVRFVRIKLNNNVEFDAVRVHTVKLNEHQLARIAALLYFDEEVNPADYKNPNLELEYLADTIVNIMEIPDAEYDRNMVNSLVL